MQARLIRHSRLHEMPYQSISSQQLRGCAFELPSLSVRASPNAAEDRVGLDIPATRFWEYPISFEIMFQTGILDACCLQEKGKLHMQHAVLQTDQVALDSSDLIRAAFPRTDNAIGVVLRPNEL